MGKTRDNIVHLVMVAFVMILAFSIKLPVNAKMGVSSVTRRYYFKNAVNTVDCYNRDSERVPFLYDKQDADREIYTDSCKWVSSNPKVAKIGTYGGGECKEFIFKKPGTVTFTCTYAGEKISVKYKVLKNANKGYIEHSEKIMTVGEWNENDIGIIFQQFPRNTYPNKKKVVWKSSNNKIIKPVKTIFGAKCISKFRIFLKAKKPGRVVINCKIGKKKYKCKVTVIPEKYKR